MTGRIDEVNKVTKLGLLIDKVGVEIKTNTSGLNGDTTLLLILTSIGGSGITSVFLSNNTGFGNEGIGKGGLSMIDVSDDGHVPDLVSLVLALLELIDREVWHILF